MGQFLLNKWEHGILPYVINYSLVTALVQNFAFLYNATFKELNISALESAVILHCNISFSLVVACVIHLSNWQQWYWIFMIIGTIITSTGLILTSYVESFITYILAYGIMTSIGVGMVLPPLLNGSIGDCIYFRRFEFNSVMLSIGGLLPAVFPLLITHLMESYNFQGTNLIISALMLNSLAGAALLHFQYKISNKNMVKKRYFAAPTEEKNVPQVPIMLVQGPDDDDTQLHDENQDAKNKREATPDIPSIILDTSNSSVGEGSRHPSISVASVKSSNSSLLKSGEKWWSKISMGSVYSASSARLYDLRAYQSVSGDEDEAQVHASQQTERQELKRRGTVDLVSQNLAVPNLTVRRKSDEGHKYSKNSSNEGKDIPKSRSMQLGVPTMKSVLGKRHGSVSSHRSGSSSSSFYITAAHSIKTDGSQGSGVWWSTLSIASVYSSGSGRMYNTREPPIFTSEEEEDEIQNNEDIHLNLESSDGIIELNEVGSEINCLEKGQSDCAEPEIESKNDIINANTEKIENSIVKTNSESSCDKENSSDQSVTEIKSIIALNEPNGDSEQLKERNSSEGKRTVSNDDMNMKKELDFKKQTLVNVEINITHCDSESSSNESNDRDDDVQRLSKNYTDLEIKCNESGDSKQNTPQDIKESSSSIKKDSSGNICSPSPSYGNQIIEVSSNNGELKHDSSLQNEKSKKEKKAPDEDIANMIISEIGISEDMKNSKRKNELLFIEEDYICRYRREWRLLGDPTSINVTLGIALSTCTDYSFILLLPLILSDINISNEETALIIFTMTVVDILSRMLTSIWTQSIKIHYKYLYFTGLIVLAISRSLFRHFTSFYALLFAGAVTGFSRGVKSIHCSITIPEHIPLHTRSSSVYLHVVSHWLVYIMLGLILGYMRDANGSYDNCIMVINILTIVGIGLCYMEIVFYLIQKKLDSRAEGKEDKQTDKLLS